MFCKFCGKELQDGEVCGCAGSQQAAAAQAQQTSGAAQAATDQMSGQVNASQADAPPESMQLFQGLLHIFHRISIRYPMQRDFLLH